MTESGDEQQDLRPDVPHGARIWNHWLGGTDDFPADREIADAVRAGYPGIPEYARPDGGPEDPIDAYGGVGRKP